MTVLTTIFDYSSFTIYSYHNNDNACINYKNYISYYSYNDYHTYKNRVEEHLAITFLGKTLSNNPYKVEKLFGTTFIRWKNFK